MEFLKSFVNSLCWMLTLALAQTLPLSRATSKTPTRREVNALLLAIPAAYFAVQMFGSRNKEVWSFSTSIIMVLPALTAALAGRRFFLWGGASILLTAALVTLLVLFFDSGLDAPHLRNPARLVPIIVIQFAVNVLLIFCVQYINKQRHRKEAQPLSTGPLVAEQVQGTKLPQHDGHTTASHQDASQQIVV